MSPYLYSCFAFKLFIESWFLVVYSDTRVPLYTRILLEFSSLCSLENTGEVEARTRGDRRTRA